MALNLKQRFPNENSAQYKQAKALYDDASISSTKFIRTSVFDADTTLSIDVSTDKYQKDPSEAHAALAKLLKDGRTLLGQGAVGMGLGEEAAAFVVGVVEKVIELNNKLKAEAVKRYEAALNQGFMLDYSKITQAELVKKYKGGAAEGK